MGAYDGVSARIAAEAGFPALWASGFCISTASGLRDSDEVSWSEVLGIVTGMVEATNLPILVDGDNGHGGFNAARRFTTRAEQIGTAGVCLEDKVFPKMNSFVDGTHLLVPIPEFCGKIEACRAAVSDPDYVIIARTEALIAGAGMEEALKRAKAYTNAGADGIFIHSKQPTISEIATFASAWGGRSPLVISPTTYYTTPMPEFTRLGIGGVIWANQSMRAAVSAIQRTCQALREHGPAATEPWIASLDDVFALMRYKELAQDEARFGAGAGSDRR
jgi:phosphoenolpyruvate phosphomutase